ncbi:MAG: MarR family winged helix-turn-helix transcriptional regulator [Burkholderiales bacterium]
MPSSKPRFVLEQTLTYRLHRLSKTTDRATQAVYANEAGIGLSEARCLTAIASFSPLSVNELAQRANLNKGQASRAAQALVAQHMVRKTGSSADGRGVVLTLTAKGDRLWQRLVPLIEERNAQIAACLSASELRQFNALLDRLLAHAQGAGDEASSEENE